MSMSVEQYEAADVAYDNYITSLGSRDPDVYTQEVHEQEHEQAYHESIDTANIE